MYTQKMKYGRDGMNISIPKKNLVKVIKSNKKSEEQSEEEVIKEALNHPIASAPLKNLVNKGESVCIVVSDVTRLWQKMSRYLPFIVKELNDAGIEDKDILFISATGSHRKQSKEEHKLILGDDLEERFEIIDHNCLEEENLTYLGTTSFGTPVKINKRALMCDHIILTGAIVFHLLAGWGGGKKSILPGISSYESIMKNHALSLSPHKGEGSNPLVRSGFVENNPLHQDMLEAASFVRPTFLFNVIMNSKGEIAHAVCGNYIKAHEKGCQIVDEMDGVFIDERADLVIATAGGYPKDINLYQTCKTVINAKEAIHKGGTMIILSECSEGFGNDEVQKIITEYNTVEQREDAIRKDYSIARYVGYFLCETAKNYDVILVGKMNQDGVKNANIKVVENIDQALEEVYQKHGKNLKTYLMPYGANTLPKLKK